MKIGDKAFLPAGDYQMFCRNKQATDETEKWEILQGMIYVLRQVAEVTILETYDSYAMPECCLVKLTQSCILEVHKSSLLEVVK